MTIVLDTKVAAHRLPAYDIVDFRTGKPMVNGKPAALPEGITTRQHEIVKTDIRYTKHTFPQFGPPLIADLRIRNVVEIAGRRWGVRIKPNYNRSGIPRQMVVELDETDDPVTKSGKHRDVEGVRITRMFGQPRFIQGTVIPHHNGRAASILAVIESFWGDAGNENVFMALDASGVPCGIYHEFSCH